ERVHLSRDPALAGTRGKKMMVPRVVCERALDARRPPEPPGSKFDAREGKPVDRAVEDAEKSNAPRAALINDYRSQATSLGVDAVSVASAIANGRGWHLNPSLPADLHALSREA